MNDARSWDSKIASTSQLKSGEQDLLCAWGKRANFAGQWLHLLILRRVTDTGSAFVQGQEKGEKTRLFQKTLMWTQVPLEM